MNFRPYILKAQLKSREIAKRFRRPAKVEPLEAFFSYRWEGPAPDSSYFNGTRFFFGPADAQRFRESIETRFAESGREAIRRADKARARMFDMLGSGEANLGDRIEWHRDFKSGRCWEKKPFGRLRLVYPDTSDIKVPWELSRLQFLTDFGRAYFINGDNAYKKELMAILNSWEAENPVDIGINWTCSMEVAIRAINIIWGMHFFDFGDDDRDFVRRIIRLLYYHALHIEQNLEIIADGADSNHLISDYLGLFYIGLLVPEFDRAADWRRIGLAGLESEIAAQVLPDGPDYEGSTSYHRQVLEMFLSAHALGKRNGLAFSDLYRERVEGMIAFSEAVTGNSGLAPLIGDNDDGFVVKLDNENPADHRPLIDIGRALLDKSAPQDIHPTEERLWYLGPDSLTMGAKAERSKSKVFKGSGYGIVRNERLHLIFNACAVPEGNFGGHKHNDLLAFTLEVDGRPCVIDPGTYCYSADYAMRNRSRSTASHNTVEVDACEQNRFLSKRLFYLVRDAAAGIDLWEETDDRVTVSGYHTGYGRLVGSIMHRRTITVFLREPSIVVTDELTGRRGVEHNFASRLILPNVEIEMDENRTVIARGENYPEIALRSSAQGFFRINIDRIEYFPRYGVRAPGYQIEYDYRARLPFTATVTITPGATTTIQAPAMIEATTSAGALA